MKSLILLWLILLGGMSRAAVVSYEGDALPEELGWERVGTFGAHRSLEDGRFVQFLVSV